MSYGIVSIPDWQQAFVKKYISEQSKEMTSSTTFAGTPPWKLGDIVTTGGVAGIVTSIIGNTCYITPKQLQKSFAIYFQPCLVNLIEVTIVNGDRRFTQVMSEEDAKSIQGMPYDTQQHWAKLILDNAYPTTVPNNEQANLDPKVVDYLFGKPLQEREP